MEPSTDAELMSRVRGGDREAFAQVVDRYKDPVVNFLSRLAGSVDRAEDLAQETFLKLYQTRDRYDERGKLGGYLFRIATNLACSEARRTTRRKLLQLTFLSGDNGNSAAPPSQQRTVLTDEVRSKVTEAIEKVPMRFRVPLLLHEIEGLSYAEIAGVVGCREGTVKSRISRGRGLLRKKLAPYFNGGVG